MSASAATRSSTALKFSRAVREQRTVVLQLDHLEPVEAQRVVDFVSGAIHALEGQSERLGETTFLFAPADVLLSST